MHLRHVFFVRQGAGLNIGAKDLNVPEGSAISCARTVRVTGTLTGDGAGRMNATISPASRHPRAAPCCPVSVDPDWSRVHPPRACKQPGRVRSRTLGVDVRAARVTSRPAGRCGVHDGATRRVDTEEKRGEICSHLQPMFPGV